MSSRPSRQADAEMVVERAGGDEMTEAANRLEIPKRGTRGRRITDVFFKLLAPLASTQVSRYRKAVDPPKMGNVPLVLLTTVGAKSGLERTSVLGGFPESDGSWLVIGSKAGSVTHPAWFINMARNADRVWLEIGKRKVAVRPEMLAGEEYERAYERIVADSKQYAGYRKVTDRHIPIVRLRPIT